METAPQTPQDTRTLEEVAKEYYSVRRSELTLSDEQTEIIVQNAQGRFTKLSAAAIETIAYLLEHADSDAVRWNVAKFVVEHNLFKQSKEADAIEQLLKDLYKDKVPNTSAAQ